MTGLSAEVGASADRCRLTRVVAFRRRTVDHHRQRRDAHRFLCHRWRECLSHQVGGVMAISSTRAEVAPSMGARTLRSTATVRIGTAEIYRAVENILEVADSLIACCELPVGNFFMPLILVLKHGAQLDEDLRREITTNLRQGMQPTPCSRPNVCCGGVPRTLTGKKMEVPVRKILMGWPSDKAAVATQWRTRRAWTTSCVSQRSRSTINGEASTQSLFRLGRCPDSPHGGANRTRRQNCRSTPEQLSA
jgi:hypothetical protein